MAKSDKREKEKTAENNPASYGAKDIFVLEGLEPVRKRPGMYIGSTGVDGLHHLVWEVVDNSIDEAMGGHAKNIVIELLPENRVSVTDDGRGIPVDAHQQTKKSALETVMTTLHAGGKFGGDGYKVSGGLHGVGVSVVNALSDYLRAEVSRDGGVYVQEYERGIPNGKVKKIGVSSVTGTKIIFSPDPQIFSTIEFNEKKIFERLRQQAYLTRGVRMTLVDRRASPPKFYSFYFEGGLRSFVEHLARGEKLVQDKIFHVYREVEKMEIEAAFLYIDAIETKEFSFANNINTPDGGMHLTGFRSALTRSVNNYARQEGYLKEKDENLTSEDTREGLVSVVLVRLPEPQFEGQTKNRLGNPEARTITETVVNEALKEFLEKHPQEGKHIVEKTLLAAKARMAAKAAKDTILRKGALDGLTLPGKLSDCSSKSAEESEIFIVEGDSAGGCFAGDTKVALVDGREASFEQLLQEQVAGKQNYCYTISKNKKVAVAPVCNVRVTRKSAKVLKVVLDNGAEIVCTPDHKFMLRDGSYREAQDLQANDSLMPLYRKHSKVGGKITIDGYEMVLNPGSHNWVFTHILSDEHNIANGVYKESDMAHRHHKDFNKLNNNPDNIVRLSSDSHMLEHRIHADKTLRRPDVVEKSRVAHQKPEFREKMRAFMTTPKMRRVLSARARAQWSDPSYKKFMVESFTRFYNENSEYRRANNDRLNVSQKKYWSDADNIAAQSERVRKYFAEHPEKRMAISRVAKTEWANRELRDLRAEMTREQWTSDFREQRIATYNRTYLNKALQTLRVVYDVAGSIDENLYNDLRRRRGDRSVIRLDTVISRFFGGDASRLHDAVVHFNHKIVRIVPLRKRIDVYDLEVPGTHNFALAGGVFVHNSAKAGRDRRTQAILPVRGKILNVEKARLDKMLANTEIRSLVIALGTAISDSFDLAKLRYHKIVLMSDADVDGAHIRTLFLTLFYRYFRPLVDAGYLYIAQPPLYRVQSGKIARYAFDDAEKDAIVKEIQSAKAEKAKGKKAASAKEDEALVAEEETDATGVEKTVGVSIQRYKGLGEMNPDQLWETTMNPENRVLKQVTIDDAEEASHLFDVLMGDQVEPRKQFIQAHAALAENLDV